MRRFGVLVLFLSFFLSLTVMIPGGVQADNPVSLIDQEGELLTNLRVFDGGEGPWIDIGSYLRSLGFSLEWDPLMERLVARNGDREVRLQTDSDRHYVNGKVRRLPVEPKRTDDRMFYPASEVDEVVSPGGDVTVHWNAGLRQIQLVDTNRQSEGTTREDPLGDIIDQRPELDAEEMLVVIDPGHGGRDPGAVGTSGLREKEVVLEISLRLRDQLEQNPDIKVHMTRTGDEFIPLDQRARQANRLDADLFVSLHANSVPVGSTSNASGFEVYTLSYESGDATDEQAAERAETENSVLWQYEGMDREEVDEDLAFIIDQLHVSANARNSQQFANMLAEGLDERTDVPNRGHRQAPFYVLNRAQMPAVLFEVGFLSNREEELRLQTDEYQQTIITTVAEMLERYRRDLY